jgi:magnesium chelatase subunit I
VQVALFNVMQEGDVQIKGYPVRLPLDVLLVFSANPEDYTARGKIITPLKDRIGAEILTHYPRTPEEGMEITRQEAWTERADARVDVLPFIAELVERIAFLAREDKRIDRRSGVSQRMPITVMETVVSNAERRTLLLGGDRVVPRVSDVYAALPAITGKMELEYEGELQGPEAIGRDLIAGAARDVFDQYWDEEELSDIVDYFDRGGVLQISDTAGTDASWMGLSGVAGLPEAIRDAELVEDDDAEARVAAAELLLEGMAAHRRISRAENGGFSRARPDRPKGKGGSSSFPFGMDLT